MKQDLHPPLHEVMARSVCGSELKQRLPAKSCDLLTVLSATRSSPDRKSTLIQQVVLRSSTKNTRVDPYG